MIQEPLERRRLNALAGREDDGEPPVPQGIDVSAQRDEQLHHRHATTDEGCTHQRSVSALVHVGAVLDHPSRERETRRVWRHVAFGHKRQRTVLAVSDWRAMECRIASHQLLDTGHVLRFDGPTELPDL